MSNDDGGVELTPEAQESTKTTDDLMRIIQLCKPQAVYDAFKHKIELNDHRIYRLAYEAWLAECADVDEYNQGTYYNDDGVLTQNEQMDYSPEPQLSMTDFSLYDLAYFKAMRTIRVDQLTTEVDGLIFDADELSQTRMARAIVGLTESGLPDISWRLYDNSAATVTKAQLAQALVQAGQAQTDIWFPSE